MKNNKNASRIKTYVIVFRLVTVIGITIILERTDAITGSPGAGRYVFAFILALLLTAVFAEKHLYGLATKLSR